MTVSELIELLEQHNPDAEVRLATQPHWPLQFDAADVVTKDGEAVYVVQGDHPDNDGPYVPDGVFCDVQGCVRADGHTGDHTDTWG